MELKLYDVVIDRNGYPYGDAIETGTGSLIEQARACANLSPTASNEYACRITEVRAFSRADAVGKVFERARRANSF